MTSQVLDKLKAIAHRYDELTELVSSPSVQADPPVYRAHSKELADLQETVDRFREYREASQALGRTLAARDGSTGERLKEAFQRIVCRSPSDRETGALLQFFETQRARFAADKTEAVKLAGDGAGSVADRAAWTALVRALLNLDEVVTKG